MAAPSTGTPVANSTWRLDVDLDYANGSGLWAQVKGIANFVPGKNDTVVDTSDYDTDGWGSDAVMSQKFNLAITLRRNKYAGSRDPGQEALLAASEGLYPIRVRWYERTSGGRAYEGWILVQWADNGGDAAGIEEASVTGLGQGARTPIANPYGSAMAPVITSLSPTGGSVAGGNYVTITGTGFNGATDVDFGATPADDFTVVSDSKIVATAPAESAGTVQVKVITAGGTSVDTAADDYTYA